MAAWRPQLLRWTSIAVAWLAAPLAAPAAGDRRLPFWLAILGLYCALSWFANGASCAGWKPARRLLLIAVLALCGLALVALGGVFAATYPVLVAALAGSTLRPGAAWAVAVAQTALLWLAFDLSRFSAADAALLALVFGGLMLFVVHTAQVARAEAAALGRLAETHQRLQQTQSLLAERSRDAERLRIAGDLHDVLGHHLTALSLTLEAGSHAGAEAKATALDAALVQTKLLLRDLRQVVSTLREDVPDLPAALRRLAAETRATRVELEIGDPLPPATVESGRALLRAAQEAITNAVRHGRAARVRLQLDERDGGLHLLACDDGTAEEREIDLGLGLAGVAERARGCGGRATWGFRQGNGFELEVWMPPAARQP
jgi:signal transduction histidine kinase